MPVSRGRKPISELPDRPDTKALNKLISNLTSATKKPIKTSPCKTVKSKIFNSPTAKKFQNDSSQTSLKGWLSKPGVISSVETKKSLTKKKTIQPEALKITTKKVDRNTLYNKESENVKTSKTPSKPTLSRYNSASSDELPTFKKKSSRKKSKQTETFRKYGVIIPSLDEIVADQQNFSNYKIQVEEAQTLREPTFKMPITSQESNQKGYQELLDCKQLTLEEITEFFNNDIYFLRDIINGKTFSARHKQYFNKTDKQDILTTNDLTYNTSTIVFTFEQVDHMVSLMQAEFDPEDTKTGYFFKVLVPELCLKIFMKTHNMNKREANAYLENRPID